VAVDGGRGFVIETKDRSLIVTAAHCLIRDGESYLPPPHGLSYTQERTYANLLGPLDGERNVWAECLFADPVADIAVLGSPDGQVLWDQAEAYDALVDAAVPLKLGALPPFKAQHHTLPDGTEIALEPIAEGAAWLLSLSGQWFACRVTSTGRSLQISDAEEGIRGGMSGSPIVAPDGRAIGIVCLATGSGDDGDDCREGGPNPFLPASLPGWLLKELGLFEYEAGARLGVH